MNWMRGKMGQKYNSRKCIVSGCDEDALYPFLINKASYCYKHHKNKGIEEKEKEKKENGNEKKT